MRTFPRSCSFIRVFKIILFKTLLLFTLSVYPHNPEELVIAEIEQGQLTFENEQIAAEYNEGLKRLRLRRLTAMSWEKKFLLFIKAGFEHIIPKGLDHIIFVLGLFFACINLRSLLLQVTIFTIAHSITLLLAALEIIEINTNIIEPLIALSIIWIAIENCTFRYPSKWRYLIIFLFGLLHGLGFATVLNQYGLPKSNFATLLFAFNIGVEIGQISVLVLTFIIIRLILNNSWKSQKIKIPISIIIGLIGLFWFIERLFKIIF